MRSEKLFLKVRRELKNLSPVGASERQMFVLFPSYDYAIKNMKTMQLKFSEQVESIQRKLNNSQKLPSISQSSKQIKTSPKTPVKLEKSHSSKPKNNNILLSKRSVNLFSKLLKQIDRNHQTEDKLERTRNYIFNKEYLSKRENKVLMSKETIHKLNDEHFQTFNYVSCRLGRRKIWKQAGEIVPKRTQQDLLRLQNSNFL